MANLYSKKGATYEALKLTTKSPASLKASMMFEDFSALFESLEGVIPAGDLGKADAAALKALADLGSSAGQQMGEGLLMPALKSAKGVLAIFQDLELQSGEAFALSMVANACLIMGEPKDSVRSVNHALSLARSSGLKKLEGAALQTLVGASVMKRDIDGALVAANDLAKLAAGKPGMASVLVARLYLVNDELPTAVKAAQEAQAACKGAGNTVGVASAMTIEYESNLAQGKPQTALKTALDAAAISKGVAKTVQASTQQLVGDAQPASKES